MYRDFRPGLSHLERGTHLMITCTSVLWVCHSLSAFARMSRHIYWAITFLRHLWISSLCSSRAYRKLKCSEIRPMIETAWGTMETPPKSPLPVLGTQCPFCILCSNWLLLATVFRGGSWAPGATDPFTKSKSPGELTCPQGPKPTPGFRLR